MSTYDDSLALHEAAHAVIGRKLTMSCGSATIVQDDDSAGHHIVADPNRIQWDWENDLGKFRDISSVFRGRIMTFMAGAEAERIMFGHTTGGEGDDETQCELMAYQAVGAPGASEVEEQRLLAQLRRHTARLVKRHMSDIRRVAIALKTKGTLTSEEIDDILLQRGKLRRSAQKPAIEDLS